MRKARFLQQADLDNTTHKLASAPREVNASDPNRFGYWSKAELLSFLKALLENERIGVTAYAAIGRAVDPQVADLAFESELAQGAICILLRKEIAVRSAARMLRREETTVVPGVECTLRRMTAFAIRNQSRSADMIEDAILNIFDSKLNAKLMYLLLLHRKQVELLETFLT